MHVRIHKKRSDTKPFIGLILRKICYAFATHFSLIWLNLAKYEKRVFSVNTENP